MIDVGQGQGWVVSEPAKLKKPGQTPCGPSDKEEGGQGGDSRAHGVMSRKDQGPQLPRDSLPSPFTSQALPPQGENLLQIRLLQKIF